MCFSCILCTSRLNDLCIYLLQTYGIISQLSLMAIYVHAPFNRRRFLFPFHKPGLVTFRLRVCANGWRASCSSLFEQSRGDFMMTVC